MTEGDYCYQKAESAPKWARTGGVCGYQVQSWLMEQKWKAMMGMLVTTALTMNSHLLWSRQQLSEGRGLKAERVRASLNTQSILIFLRMSPAYIMCVDFRS